MDKYEVLKVVGEGTFGKVSRVRRIADRRELVWKEIDYGRMREHEKQLIVSEVNILRELKHPHIVRYLDRIIDKAHTKIYIVMENCEGGDLRQLISAYKRERRQFDEQFIWRTLYQCVSALAHCHRRRDNGKLKPILHRDLKPANILLDKANNVKIGDFGLAKELGSESVLAKTNVGTPFYMSPELTNNQDYSAPSDIWAIGCLVYEMAAQRPPFVGKNQLSLALSIQRDSPSRQHIPAQYSEQLWRAIVWMLNKDAKRRPTVRQVEALPEVVSMGRQAMRAAQKEEEAARARSAAAAAAAAEAALRAREAAVARKEAELAKRETGLNRREEGLRAREAAVANAATGPGRAAGVGGVAAGVKALARKATEISGNAENHEQKRRHTIHQIGGVCGAGGLQPRAGGVGGKAGLRAGADPSKYANAANAAGLRFGQHAPMDVDKRAVAAMPPPPPVPSGGYNFAVGAKPPAAPHQAYNPAPGSYLNGVQFKQ